MNPSLTELRSAYRECARVLIAYKEGFSLADGGGIAVSGQSGVLQFGKYEELYKAIFLYSQQPEQYKKLSPEAKKEEREFMIQLQKIASARASGELFLFVELSEQERPVGPVREHPAHDAIDQVLLTEMKKIWKHLREEMPEGERPSYDTDELIDSEVQSGSDLFLYFEGYRPALVSLAEALLSANGQLLNKAQVEQVLELNGYFEFLESQLHRSEVLLKKLQLKAHPEGGFYSEIYRSKLLVQHKGKDRAVLTSIYFLLTRGQVSRWHVVDADEAWHFYEGQPIELYVMPPDFSKVEKIMLGFFDSKGTRPAYVVPAGWWQASKTSDEYSLCGCTVAPGFEFSGFRMLNAAEKAAIKQKFPGLEFLA